MAQRTARNLAAAKLRLTNIPGTARVRLGDGPRMSLELTGPDALTNDIRWEVRGDTLHVEGPQFGGGGLMISSFGPGGSVQVHAGRGTVVSSGDMFVSGRGVVIGGTSVRAGRGQTIINTGGRAGQVIVDGRVVSGEGAGEPAEMGDVELIVYVPGGAPVQVADDGAGTYEIGRILGTFGPQAGGQQPGHRRGDGRHPGLRRRAQRNSGRLGAAGAAGQHLRVRVFTAPEGTVTDLNVSISGSGQVAYGGVAVDADLDVSGSGHIRVDTVTGTLRRDVSGSGRIEVRVPPRQDRDDFWS